MFYCPQCGAEYREGYSSCSDCHVLLTRERLSASPVGLNKEFRVVWRGTDQQECVSVCYQLQDVDIPYKVTETPGPLRLKMQVNKRYELAVSTDDYQRAKSALDIENDPPETFSESAWQEMEEPEDLEEAEQLEASEQQAIQDENEFSPDDLPDTPARRNAYFRYWYPEDATVQVWPQEGPDDWSGAIEMALKENLIHCRVDSDGGNGRAVFVMPEDEARAHEIVREIIEGTPME